MPPIDFTRRTALYRLFDESGALLYIGIAFDPEARWKGHVRKPWWHLVAARTVEWFDTRLLAAEAETRAIEAERPIYNVDQVDSPAPVPAGMPSRTQGQVVLRVSDELWEAFGRACADKGLGSRAVGLRMHMKAVVAEFERKQQRKARDAAAAAARD